MNNQIQENEEYMKFWTKFSQKLEEIQREYNKLSDENKERAKREARECFAAQGIVGIANFLKNLE